MATRTAKKPRMGLDWYNNNFARRSRYLYISLPSLHNYGVKRPIFTFYWGRKHKKGMSDPLFVHVFMTKPEIVTFTFCTNIFRLSGIRKALQEFYEHFASQTAIKRPHRKYRLGNFFLPVIKFKLYTVFWNKNSRFLIAWQFRKIRPTIIGRVFKTHRTSVLPHKQCPIISNRMFRKEFHRSSVKDAF